MRRILPSCLRLVVIALALLVIAAPAAATPPAPVDLAAAKLALWGSDRRLALAAFSDPGRAAEPGQGRVIS